MSSPRCRAKDPLTCRDHGSALAKGYFTPLSGVRNFGVASEALQAFAAQSKAVKERLPLELRWDLDSYTGTIHSSLNAYLRAGVPGLVENALREDYRDRERTPELIARVTKRSEALIPVLRERVRDLDRAFELAEQPVAPRVLYRTLRVQSPSSTKTTTAGEKKAYINEHYPVGSIITSKAYTSTSIDSDLMLTQARKRPSQLIVQEILTSRGLALHDELPGNVQHVEREVLLPRNMKFEVLAVGNATYESSGAGPELPFFFGAVPEKKRYPVIQLREVL